MSDVLTAHETAIELKGITKTFGAVVANDNIDLDVKKGEISPFLARTDPEKLH